MNAAHQRELLDVLGELVDEQGERALGVQAIVAAVIGVVGVDGEAHTAMLRQETDGRGGESCPVVGEGLRSEIPTPTGASP
jgi:hypothetical protein